MNIRGSNSGKRTPYKKVILISILLLNKYERDKNSPVFLSVHVDCRIFCPGTYNVSIQCYSERQSVTTTRLVVVTHPPRDHEETLDVAVNHVHKLTKESVLVQDDRSVALSVGDDAGKAGASMKSTITRMK